MTEYLITDTVKEIIYKNKKNILTLFSEYDKTNITIQQLQTELTNLGIKLGDYTSDDTAGVLDHNVSVIRNLAIAVDNSNAISARVKVIEDDGGGGIYIGTYNGATADDISNLPAGNDRETAIIQFLDTGETKYQEYKFINNSWTKIGGVLDSHIHTPNSGQINTPDGKESITADGYYTNGNKKNKIGVVLSDKLDNINEVYNTTTTYKFILKHPSGLLNTDIYTFETKLVEEQSTSPSGKNFGFTITTLSGKTISWNANSSLDFTVDNKVVNNTPEIYKYE